MVASLKVLLSSCCHSLPCACPGAASCCPMEEPRPPLRYPCCLLVEISDLLVAGSSSRPREQVERVIIGSSSQAWNLIRIFLKKRGTSARTCVYQKLMQQQGTV